MLISLMHTKKCTEWAEMLWEVQFCKNRSLHAGIHRSPYEAMFGSKPKVGLTSSILPDEIIATLQTEEDLEAALGTFDSAVEESTRRSPESDIADTAPGTSISEPLESFTPLEVSDELFSYKTDKYCFLKIIICSTCHFLADGK